MADLSQNPFRSFWGPSEAERMQDQKMRSEPPAAARRRTGSRSWGRCGRIRWRGRPVATLPRPRRSS